MPTIGGGPYAFSHIKVLPKAQNIEFDAYSLLAPRASLTELDLAEQYENEQAHCDGEIFRKIRQYHRLANKDGENKWWSRLTETKRKDLRQLLKDERYASVFDAMLPWPGMWTPIRLGSLHRLLTMRCDEVRALFQTCNKRIAELITD